MIVGQNIINHLGALVIYVLIIPSKLIVIKKDAKKPKCKYCKELLINYFNNMQGLDENIC